MAAEQDPWTMTPDGSNMLIGYGNATLRVPRKLGARFGAAIVNACVSEHTTVAPPTTTASGSGLPRKPGRQAKSR
jgi:hypothetical protein